MEKALDISAVNLSMVSMNDPVSNKQSSAELSRVSPLQNTDALELIFRFVDGFHLGRCLQVCALWQTVGLDEKLWSTLCSLEQVPVAGPRPTWFRTFTEFSAGSWRFRTSTATRAALRASMPLLTQTASSLSLFSWTPMQQPRRWQWGSWELCNLNECLYISSTIGVSRDAPFPWLVIEIVANSNGWFRFSEERVVLGQKASVAWEVNDIDDDEQPFEKPECGASVQLDVPLLPCGLYRGGLPEYPWDILVRPRQLFVINPDIILEFRKNTMAVLFSDENGSVLIPRAGRISGHSLSTWLMNQPSAEDEGSEDDDDPDLDEMHSGW